MAVCSRQITVGWDTAVTIPAPAIMRASPTRFACRFAARCRTLVYEIREEARKADCQTTLPGNLLVRHLYESLRHVAASVALHSILC